MQSTFSLGRIYQKLCVDWGAYRHWKSARKRFLKWMFPHILGGTPTTSRGFFQSWVGWFFGLHEGKQDPGSLFPCIFLKYLTNPNSTQVLAISARTEQYALFLRPITSTKILNEWTLLNFRIQNIPDWRWRLSFCFLLFYRQRWRYQISLVSSQYYIAVCIVKAHYNTMGQN